MGHSLPQHVFQLTETTFPLSGSQNPISPRIYCPSTSSKHLQILIFWCILWRQVLSKSDLEHADLTYHEFLLTHNMKRGTRKICNFRGMPTLVVLESRYCKVSKPPLKDKGKRVHSKPSGDDLLQPKALALRVVSTGREVLESWHIRYALSFHGPSL